jgi:hypothetical protein
MAEAKVVGSGHVVGIKVWTRTDGQWVWWGCCHTCGARQEPKPATEYELTTAWCEGHAAIRAE